MISIIAPVLNEATALLEFLAHARSLEGDKEIIVVDGGSSDGTADLARQTPGVRVLAAQRGRGAQIQVGAEIAKGEVVLALHADCRLPRNALRAIDSHGAQWGWFDIEYASRRPSVRAVAWGLNRWARTLGSPVGEQAVFARRDVWERAGGCPTVPLMEDLLLARRLRSVAPGTPLPGPVTCSSRRYEAWSVTGMGLRCALLLTGFHLGVPPSALSRLYPPIR